MVEHFIFARKSVNELLPLKSEYIVASKTTHAVYWELGLGLTS